MGSLCWFFNFLGGLLKNRKVFFQVRDFARVLCQSLNHKGRKAKDDPLERWPFSHEIRNK